MSKADTIKLLEAQLEAKRNNKLLTFKPYPKQVEFFAATKDHTEVALRAGNQQGKSESASYFVAVALTGRIPKNWPGRKWDRPIRAWMTGESAVAVRDIGQRKLFGGDGALGTGFIPKDAIVKVVPGHGAGGAFDKVIVRHVSGGVSEISAKSYDQDVSKWQGESLDLLWCDEEPDEAHYTEGLARTIATNGLVISTFTPLKGVAQILPRFDDDSPEAKKHRKLVAMDIEDALHLRDPERRAALMSTFPQHQREARLHGLPMMGSGRVWTFPEEDISCDPFQIPPHWSRLWGIDFGLRHPFAAVLVAWDKDADTIFVTNTIRMSDKLPIDHAAAMKPFGANVPVAWPQDGTQRKEFEGALTPTAEIYRKHGLKMLHDHAKFPDGSNSTEAGIMEMSERMRSNRFKVFKTCIDWFAEYRQYHRDSNAQLVKLRDDLLSATRVGVMARRFARASSPGVDRFGHPVRAEIKIAHGADSYHFGIDE
jgi:phage terminase large subunit-like protein